MLLSWENVISNDRGTAGPWEWLIDRIVHHETPCLTKYNMAEYFLPSFPLNSICFAQVRRKTMILLKRVNFEERQFTSNLNLKRMAGQQNRLLSPALWR